jgi:hypothetical protein
MSDNPSLKVLSPVAAQDLIGYSVEQTILEKYDNLSLLEFKAVLIFYRLNTEKHTAK